MPCVKLTAIKQTEVGVNRLPNDRGRGEHLLLRAKEMGRACVAVEACERGPMAAVTPAKAAWWGFRNLRALRCAPALRRVPEPLRERAFHRLCP